MARLLTALLLTALCSVSQAETYSVCENCVLESATAEYFEAHYPGDYEGIATMKYSGPVRSEAGDKLNWQTIIYNCVQEKLCYRGLKSLAEITFQDGHDPLKTFDPNAEYKPVTVTAKVKVGGKKATQSCYLGQTLDPEGKYGYSYKNGVNVYCILTVDDYLAINFNLYFKRL
jgi:hypothetical protein